MKNIVETINFLTENKIHFAIFSLPNSKEIKLIVSENKVFESSNGFAIQEFDSAIKTYFIANDIELSNTEIQVSTIAHCKDVENLHKEKEEDVCLVLSKNEYKEYVADCVAECEQMDVQKIVPTRIKVVEKPPYFDIGIFFLKLVEQYSSTFVHLYYHAYSGMWIGASPELLLKKGTNNKFETFSLAGTKLISNNRDWTSKEYKEQQIVTDYIVDLLQNKECKVELPLEVKTVEAGQIQHLKTSILFSSDKKFTKISNWLHPTPAVCGMPKEVAFSYIQNRECNGRKCYTGYVGIHTDTVQQCFVNLRCMQILQNELYVFVGAGVTKDSIPEKEWLETENKSKTLLNLL